MKPVALTIAGSDPSGGAGIQADLKTFHQFGVYGMSVISLLTVQNTQSVHHSEVLDPDLVADQLDLLLSDIPPNAIKTGALGTKEIVEVVADRAQDFHAPLIVDPVMISQHGTPLLDEEGRVALKKGVFPYATLVTPNLFEAEAMTGRPSKTPITEMAKAIADLGPKAVLITGERQGDQAVDLLYYEGEFQSFASDWIDTSHAHGTGCTLSAAITAGLAKGDSLIESIETAKRFVTEAIRTHPGLGRGLGPLNHHATL